MTEIRKPNSLPEECDCDLALDPHPMSKVHFRCCRALHPEFGDVFCFVIRGHKGGHRATVYRDLEWSREPS